MSRRFFVYLILFNMLSVRVSAQSEPVAEIFCGAELNYADINFTRLYNVLLNVAPGAKVHLGNDWDISAQVFWPFINEGYPKRNSMVRLNMANISKEIHFVNANQHFKLTAGLFSRERYGSDIRWMYPINSWLLVQARTGIVSDWRLGFDWSGGSESEFGNKWNLFCTLGANVWLNPWNTELRASGGRYLNKDYGVEFEVIRHFNHCSVSMFLSKHERIVNTGGAHSISGGFRIVMMLPPYTKEKRKILFRPASNFRLTYNAQSDGYSMKKYNTDPEENERTNPINVPWGTGNFNE